jgi:DNA (cytosine-5)-methyltransferase 1
MVAQTFTVVDLFAGIGGLSLGFEMAGATIVAAVESNPHHVAAYRNGHLSSTLTMAVSVEDIGATDILSSTNLQRGELDFLVGGPPCQAFSMAGKRKGTGDARGSLVWHFCRLVEELQPRVFVMENVLGLKSIHGGELFRDLISALESHSFKCQAFVLDAADYGVPQHRKRLFVVGTRIDGVSLEAPPPTHRSSGDWSLLSQHLSAHRTVRDAIWDLRGSRHQKMTRTVDDGLRLPYYSADSADPNDYQQLMRGNEVATSGNGITVHFPRIVENIRILALPQGSVEPRTRYRRLYWQRPAFTLRAGSGSFTALRPIHPSQSRVITVREAARLQSFPDRVQFSPAKKWAYQQIGNSVPPLLGAAIAGGLIRSLARARARTL